MKVAIPSISKGENKRSMCAHFGKTAEYSLFDTESNKTIQLKNTNELLGGCAFAPEMLKNNDVDALVCYNISQKALARCLDLGITVHVGAIGNIKEVLRQWKEGTYPEATIMDSCKMEKSIGYCPYSKNRETA